MKHGSLFSGIGGFDLAAEWMGWENVFHCEWNEFGQRILKYYWPNAISYHDITKTDFTIHRGQIDILTGGFPCQPYSAAGKRLGTEDDRHLWPSMLRAIREIQPRYVVGENVYGLINWSGGLVFDQVQADLEAEGYEVIPVVVPACAVNAPHRRDRVWFVAYAKNDGSSTGNKLRQETGIQERSIYECEGKGRDEIRPITERYSQSGTAADTERQRSSGQEHWQPKSKLNTKDNQGIRWSDFPTQPPIRGRDDGLSGRLDGITFPKWRNESIKAYGNAVVPQVVYEIFKAIAATDAESE